ncbi:MAG TPA: homocysteine biosynthesis protein [Halanaerobiales bacterium]|nr:homocysteine biosynthesis protein [Halanaerobiales bacterium]
MSKKKSIEEINERIKKGEALVLTAEEMGDFVDEHGEETAFKEVDVVTTATFGAMCSSGAFLNFGHPDPPIRMERVWLNDVLAYAGLAAVDVYLGATEESETEGSNYGGAHVIQDLLQGKDIKLRAIAKGTDCYPRKELETYINLEDLNQAYLYNPRNAYQNYWVAVNSSSQIIYTYMGPLYSHFGNASYSSAGQLSPLLNDPYYRTIGIGTRIFLGGAQGYISWEGTQHNPSRERTDKGIPVGGAGTLAVSGDLKEMSPEYIAAACVERYGVSMYVGLGVPIPIIDREMVKYTAVRDRDIYVMVNDYSGGSRDNPVLGQVNYEELRSGEITLSNGIKVQTAPLSSYHKARKIAGELKNWIRKGEFLLTEPVQKLSTEREFKSLEIRQGAGINV